MGGASTVNLTRPTPTRLPSVERRNVNVSMSINKRKCAAVKIAFYSLNSRQRSRGTDYAQFSGTTQSR